MIQDIDNINVSIQDDNNVNVTVENDSINISEGTPTDIAEIMHNEEIRQENEAQRIANEEQRIENETAREEYITDLKQRVEAGEFDGEDGYSPTATVVKENTTATITITDKNGTTTASISDGTDGRDGVDGQDGTDGEDGFSPVVTMEKQGKVTTLTITDATGTHTTEIKDGNDGSGTGDMLKSTYDINDNGVVDNAEKVNNHTVETDVPANAVFTDTTYTAGTGISISAENVISNTQTSAAWGNITGTLADQTDLKTELDKKLEETDLPIQGELDFYITVNTPFIFDNYNPGIYYLKQPSGNNKNYWYYKGASNTTLKGGGSVIINSCIVVYKKFSDASTGDIIGETLLGKWATYSGTMYELAIDKIYTQELYKTSEGELDYKLLDTSNYLVTNGKTNTFHSVQKYSNLTGVTFTNDYDIPNKKYVDDLGNTKQNVIDSSHMLDADLVDDTNASNKFLTTSAQDIWGKKTFQSLPEYAYTTNPVLDTQFVHKKYVDSKFMYQRDNMPTAGEDYYNKIFQYIGTTNANYTNGYFYKCERSGTSPNYTYSWVRTDAQPSFSGDYNDLSNKPTIPDELADLSDDSTHRVVTDTEKTTWSGKQDALVSGTNIKTINNTSILGSGDIEVGADIPQQDTAPSNPEEDDLWIDTDEPGSTIAIDSAVSTTSTNPIENQAITNYVNTMNEYSTTEINTKKKWIDGKPIYRKVLTANNLANNSSLQLQHGISNLGQLVLANVIWYDTSDNRWFNNFRFDNSSIYIRFGGLSSTIAYVNCAGVDWSLRTSNVRVVLEYTKSTD